MLRVLEFLTGFYWILIPRFMVESLVVGKGKEAAVFYTDLGGAWSGHQIKSLLSQHNISMYGWGYAFDQFYFRVPIDDAPVASQVMLEAGVELIY